MKLDSVDIKDRVLHENDLRTDDNPEPRSDRK